MFQRKRLAIGFLVFISLLLVSPAVMAAADAAKGTAAGEKTDSTKKFIALAAGFGIAIAVVGGAMAQGRAASAALEGIARNPQASGKIFVPMILGLALIESLVIYALIIAFQLVGKL